MNRFPLAAPRLKKQSADTETLIKQFQHPQHTKPATLCAFHKAARQITADDIYAAVPFCTPKTGVATAVAECRRFDVATWVAAGSPVLTEGGWVALCRVIAGKDEVNLGSIFAACDQVEARLAAEKLEAPL